MQQAPPDFNSIIVCGKFVKLNNRDVKVVTFAHPEGIEYSFPAKSRANEAAGKPRLMAERIKKGQRINPMNLEAIQETVHMVVLHTDLTSTAKKCFNALVGRNLSTHFMIDWDGVIYQGMDLGYQSFHGGGINSVSIGIDLNNKMPNLAREPDAPMYPEGHDAFETRTADGWPHKRPRSERKKYNGGRVQSFGYTDPQYRALIALLAKLTEQDMFPRIKRVFPMDAKGEAIPNVVEGGDAFEGIVGHMHVSATRWDPGPGFDWQRMLSGMVSENNSFPILLSGGDTIGGLLERQRVKKLAESYFELNEAGTVTHKPGTSQATVSAWSAVEPPEGGWFPMGPNQTWHGGIHLQAPANTPVQAMFEGKLVAARFNRCPTRLGSNNFICLRHEVELPASDSASDKEAQKKLLVFYSLYMHLDYIDVFSEEAKKTYTWVQKLHQVGEGEDEGTAALEVVLDDEDEPKAGKKKKKKKKKKEKEKEEPPLAVDDDDDEFGQIDDDCPQTKPQRHGPGLGMLREGSVATIEFEKSPVVISSSEHLAPIGWFDPSGDENDNLRQVHVQVFADDSWKKAVDMAVHGQFFTEIRQVDINDRSLFVRNRGLLSAFAPSGYVTTKNSLVKGRVLSRSEIIELFTENESNYKSLRKRLRKVVVKSMSEWSDQVDWVKALSEAEDWNGKVKDYKLRIRESGLFKETLERVLPFVWLDGEVAEAIGLKTGGKGWTGHLWHFHPIHFILWLTYHSAQRVQKLSRSISKKRLKELKALEEATEDGHKDGTEKQVRDTDYGAALDDADVEDVDIGEILEEFLTSDDVGEWQEVRARQED